MKRKKRSKHELLAQQGKELSILKSKNEELIKEVANYFAQTEKLKQELDKNEILINAVKTRNDREEAEYKTNIDQLKRDLKKRKRAINALQFSKDELKKELSIQ